MCGLLDDEQCHSVLDHSLCYDTKCYRYPKPKVIDSLWVVSFSNNFFSQGVYSQSQEVGDPLTLSNEVQFQLFIMFPIAVFFIIFITINLNECCFIAN